MVVNPVATVEQQQMQEEGRERTTSRSIAIKVVEGDWRVWRRRRRSMVVSDKKEEQGYRERRGEEYCLVIIISNVYHREGNRAVEEQRRRRWKKGRGKETTRRGIYNSEIKD